MFSDVEVGSAHENDVGVLWSAGVTKGCGMDPLRFCPEQSVKRGQLASLLVRAGGVGSDAGGEEDDGGGGSGSGGVAAGAGRSVRPAGVVTVPDAPRSLVVTAASEQLLVGWRPPRDDGGSALTGYSMQWREAGGAWDAAVEVDWSSPRGLDTRFMRPCDGSSCPPIRLVAAVRSWSEAGGGCTRLRSTIGLTGGLGAGCGSRLGGRVLS